MNYRRSKKKAVEADSGVQGKNMMEKRDWENFYKWIREGMDFSNPPEGQEQVAKLVKYAVVSMTTKLDDIADHCNKVIIDDNDERQKAFAGKILEIVNRKDD